MQESGLIGCVGAVLVDRLGHGRHVLADPLDVGCNHNPTPAEPVWTLIKAAHLTPLDERNVRREWLPMRAVAIDWARFRASLRAIGERHAVRTAAATLSTLVAGQA